MSYHSFRKVTNPIWFIIKIFLDWQLFPIVHQPSPIWPKTKSTFTPNHSSHFSRSFFSSYSIYKRYKYEMHPGINRFPWWMFHHPFISLSHHTSHSQKKFFKGNYIFYDVSQMNMNSCAQEDIACFVLASVIGIYKERNRILIDAGALALSKDSGIHYGGQHSAYGLIVGHENLQLVSLSQEVGIIEAKEGHSIDFGQFYIGKLLRIFPNHSCLTAAHYDRYNLLIPHHFYSWSLSSSHLCPRFVVIDEQENIIDHWDTCKREW